MILGFSKNRKVKLGVPSNCELTVFSVNILSMLELLAILYLTNGIAFVAGTFFAMRGYEIMGPPFVRHPNPLNLVLAVFVLPLHSLLALTPSGDRRLTIQLVFQILYFVTIVWFYGDWESTPAFALAGAFIWLFIARKAATGLER